LPEDGEAKSSQIACTADPQLLPVVSYVDLGRVVGLWLPRLFSAEGCDDVLNEFLIGVARVPPFTLLSTIVKSSTCAVVPFDSSQPSEMYLWL
jgi:hypothetical protein